MINNCLKNILSHIIPHRCIVCKAFANNSEPPLNPYAPNMCSECRQALPELKYACAKCCQPIHIGELCGKCITESHYFDIVYCAYAYNFPIDKLIHQIKYGDKPEMIRCLGDLLIDHIHQHRDIRTPPELLIPVPSHPSRIRQRGFNQSLELTKHLSSKLNITFLRHSIAKCKATSPLASLNLKKRQVAIRNSFRVKQPVNAKHVAIVDDVMTSGATASELARTLKRDGVKYVEVWCIARA